MCFKKCVIYFVMLKHLKVNEGFQIFILNKIAHGDID